MLYVNNALYNRYIILLTMFKKLTQVLYIYKYKTTYMAQLAKVSDTQALGCRFRARSDH